MIETEVKIRLTKKRFYELYDFCKNPRFVFQENWVLVNRLGYTRIRIENNKIIFTKKEKRDFFSRKEIEFEIFSFGKGLQLCGEQDIGKYVYYKKQHSRLNFNCCTICFDIVKKNYFIEIEGNLNDIYKTLKLLNIKNPVFEKKKYWEFV